MLTKNNKNKNLERNEILTELALERTILAKQRTTLAEISIFLSIIGLSLLLFKFFNNLVPKITGVGASLFSIFMITRLFNSYKLFKKKINKIDKKNNFT